MRRSLERAVEDIVGPDIALEMREMSKQDSDAFWRRVLDREHEHAHFGGEDDPDEVF